MLNWRGSGYIRIAFICATLLLTSVKTFAQRNLSDIHISIIANELSLNEVLSLIANKSGFEFSYNPKKIALQQKVNYRANNKSVSAILTDVATASGLTFELVENQIILKPDKRSATVPDQTVTISGTLKDADSGEALIGAAIYIPKLQTGAVTNAFGFYSLTIPKGTYNLSTSHIGYASVVKTITLAASLREDLVMTSVPFEISEDVTIVATPVIEELPQPGNLNITPASVEDRPAFFGEMDVVKSLESVPGIKFHSDGSSFYYVRGGHRDQNLVLIDDAPVFNPSHMLGIFSTLIPDAVNSITLYKGDMPASLGGRLSSVLDVRTKKGNDQHFQAWGNAGFISTKMGIEGPIQRHASSYLFSGRVSTLGWIAKLAEENIDQFRFHDLTGKVNVRFGQNNRVFFSVYSSGDNYFNNNNGIAWANTAATLQWNHLFSDKLFMNTTLAAGGYDYFLYTDVRNNTRWNSHISNLNLKSDFSYFVSPDSEITLGTAISAYNFNPGNVQSALDLTGFPSLSVRNSLELILYGNHDIKINNKFRLNYGLRLSSWSNSGESYEFIFDESRNVEDTLFFSNGQRYKKFRNLEPRLALSCRLGENASLKTSYSRNVQNVHLISNSISPFTSLDVWLPSSYNIQPQRSNQVALGYYRQLPSDVSVSAEAFYKKMFNQIDYNAHAEVLLNPLIERELRFGTATAYGLELMAKKDKGRLRGLAGYTFSRAKRNFPEVNNGQTYNAFYDRPHQANVMVNYDLTQRWTLGANFTYLTGAPYSSPVSFYTNNGAEIPVYGQKNNTRLPNYHRLDLSATYRINKNAENKFVHDISFQVYNFYARKNVLFVNYNKTEAEDGSLKVPTDLSHANRITSQFYLFQFTPSISYNFKWL